jgi:hypothetical protein
MVNNRWAMNDRALEELAQSLDSRAETDPAPTTAEERAHWKPLFSGFRKGSAPEFTYRLIADVDRLTTALARAEAGRERYRKALERIARDEPYDDWAVDIANAALDATDGEK